jgi:membrane dipeptidase
MPDYAQEMMLLALRAIGHKAEDDVPSLNYVNGFENYTDYINITRGLVSRGYSDNDIRFILGENWLRVFEKVCG